MAEANLDMEYRCLLCMKPYDEPRELPCGHTFCCQCLSSYIEVEHVTADEDRHYVPCPVCDAPITPCGSSNDVKSWAISFPVNKLFLSTTAPRSDERVCEACLRDNETSPADIWCTDCVEMLCKQCRTAHGRIKLTAKHRLVPIGENVGRFRDMTFNGDCSKHDGRTLDIYCLDHSAMCCSICVSLSHRRCNNIKPLRDVIEKTMTERISHETEWEDITEETKKMLDDDDSGMALLSSKEKEVSAEMTHRIQNAKDKIDNLNTTFQSELTGKCNAHRKQLSARRKYVYTFHTNANNSNVLMTRLEQQCSDRDRFIMREKTKNQMSGHYRRMDQNTKNKSNRFDITLKLGTIIDEIMKVTTVGNVDVNSTISSTSQDANIHVQTLMGSLLSVPSATTFADSTSTSDLACSLQDLTVQTPPLTERVDVWTGSVSCVQTVLSSTLGGSHRPCLRGGIFTENEELLMTDANNNRLLLFNDTYVYLRKFKVNGKPADIARGRTADEIFVTIETIQILRCTLRNGQLSVISMISSPHNTMGIAVFGDNILVGTHDSVKILTMDGTVTKSIKKNEHFTYVAVSTSKGTVYHTDNNDVVCRRLDSDTEVYRYRDAGLENPMGIDLDRDDNVYVCGRSYGNVYLVSPDGSRGRVLLPKVLDITEPWCIVVHPTKQEFVVTSWVNSTTSLEVYGFSNKE